MRCDDDMPCSNFLIYILSPTGGPHTPEQEPTRRPAPLSSSQRDDGPPPASPLSSRGTPPVPAAGLVSSQRKGNSSGMFHLKPI